MYATFQIEYRNLVWRKPRKEVFNLKNPDCKKIFTEVTNNSLKLKKCFGPNSSFPNQCNRFFKKVRVGTHSGVSKDIEELLCEKSKLKMFLTGNDY